MCWGRRSWCEGKGKGKGKGKCKGKWMAWRMAKGKGKGFFEAEGSAGPGPADASQEAQAAQAQEMEGGSWTVLPDTAESSSMEGLIADLREMGLGKGCSDGLLREVLESHGGDLQRAVESLLR